MVQDGLWDPYSDTHMGECGELCVREHAISRQDQDAHARASIARARTAAEKGITAWVGHLALDISSEPARIKL